MQLILKNLINDNLDRMVFPVHSKTENNKRILKRLESKEEANQRTYREQEKVRLVRLYFYINISIYL